MHDLKELKLSTNIVDVINRYVPLHKNGSEHYGVCPFHNDEKESLQVNEKKQIFKCFACDKGGDVMDFLTLWGKGWKEIIDELKDANGAGGEFAGEKANLNRAKAPTWRNAIPTGEAIEIKHHEHGYPNAVWAYRNADGIVCGYVCRFDQADGEKMVIPYTYKTDGQKYSWIWQGFDRPRPLYNLDKLIADPKRTAVIVEGEKTADAADRLLKTGIATTWAGGSNAIKAIDLTPLYGRNIVLWPDNDYTHAYGKKHEKAGQTKPFHEQPGNLAMLSVYELLKNHCPNIVWVRNPSDVPCGWDIADCDWMPEQTLEYAKANFLKAKDIAKEAADYVDTQSRQGIEVHEMSQPPEYREEPRHAETDFFRCLGYEKSETGGQYYHFYSFVAKTVIKLAPSSMSKSNLMQVAPINYWENNFPGKQGVHIDSAQNYLIQRCHDVGMFNEKWIRGRGAWIDKGSVVIHAGNHLVVNGVPSNFSSHKSKFIYEMGDELGFDVSNPLQNTQSARLMEVLNLLNWQRNVNSYLLAGWCVVAPICGALNWRPHVWLTGAAGTGKSWVFREIVRKLLGDTSLSVQGETSEAGLRQTLKNDALPIVFDEAEGNEKRDQDRMQAILALMRQSSSTDGGSLLKGSSGGTAKSFRIRSCFAFASIGDPVSKQSDRTRVTTLSIVGYPDKTDGQKAVKTQLWEQLQAKYNEIVTDEFCAGIRARTISLLPVILKNARTFSNAAAAVLGQQRTGDQIGTLLSGAYSLVSNKEISFEDAVKWVKEKEWTEERSQDATRDELQLLSHILEQITRVETSTGTVERTIGELVMIGIGVRDDTNVTTEMGRDRLKRLGLKVSDNDNLEDPQIFISDSASPVRAILRDTPWSKNHKKILMRIETATEIVSCRFSAGVSTRAVRISINQMLKEN